MDSKIAVLLLNIGTPDNPRVSGVRRYLTEFLNDKRVINGPWLFRKILVNLIIVPFRSRNSSRLYQKLWTPKGSPLLVYGRSLEQKLQEKLGDGYIVRIGMNYGEPGIRRQLISLQHQPVHRVFLFPLFPQYASSSTGSTLEKSMRFLANGTNVPAVNSVVQYYDHPLYLKALAEKVRGYDYLNYDHILISFHGLPLNQVYDSHKGVHCDQFDCTRTVSPENQFCYHATCYATARLLANQLQLDEARYTVCFQSRLSRNWLTPFTDKLILKLAREGKKRLLVICPSFTSDCLETTVEIGIDGKELFIRNGGQELQLVESLNDSESWIDAVHQMLIEQIRGM